MSSEQSSVGRQPGKLLKAAIYLQQEKRGKFDEADNNKSIKGKLSVPRKVAADPGDLGSQGCPCGQSNELTFECRQPTHLATVS